MKKIAGFIVDRRYILLAVILVLSIVCGVVALDTEINKDRIQYLSDDIAERELNGESIYHIYHVRMITEFLLRELSACKPEKALSEEDIIEMSIASSIHDIGKLQIPKSILDYL